MSSFVDIGLAFIEGVALILSPCILPILPLVLSTAIGGGKSRPFGIITGFITSFCVFAFFSRWLVLTLGIDISIIKYVSLALLTLLGITMLSHYLSEKFAAFTQRFADFGNRFSNGAPQDGFISGIGIGLLIGLIWTPCAGPILAVVLVQVIRQNSNWQGFLTLLAFSIGAGVPMLIIALLGRSVMQKLQFFKRHAEAIRRTLGAIILFSVVLIASGFDQKLLVWQSAASNNTATQPINSTDLEDALGAPYPAPEFIGIDTWLNSPPLTMSSLKGKVVLVDFWTYSCINCVRTLPYITTWDKRYRDKGLIIIGVHAPEFEFEKNIDNIKTALQKYNIHYPVAVDNNLATWDNFNNQYWPAHYLIDKNGRVVYTHFGEGDYDVTEHNIQVLLGLKSAVAPVEGQKENFNVYQTPETYFGYARAERFSNDITLQSNHDYQYTFPPFLRINHWSLNGQWFVAHDKIITTAANAKLRMNFNAKKVFMVLGTRDNKPITVTITLNGKPVGTNAGADAPKGILTVDKHALYELIDQKEATNGLLEITVQQPGLEAYTFTFG